MFLPDTGFQLLNRSGSPLYLLFLDTSNVFYGFSLFYFKLNMVLYDFSNHCLLFLSFYRALLHSSKEFMINVLILLLIWSSFGQDDIYHVCNTVIFIYLCCIYKKIVPRYGMEWSQLSNELDFGSQSCLGLFVWITDQQGTTPNLCSLHAELAAPRYVATCRIRVKCRGYTS